MTITAPSPAHVALLLGLSFFLGLAFEEYFAHTDERRPGGIRTFPMLAITGGVLYLFDPEHYIPFTAGLLILGAWLLRRQGGRGPRGRRDDRGGRASAPPDCRIRRRGERPRSRVGGRC